ncbi:unnamed protein product [Pocillopora meandrina]|uniref:Uncharacterized protein n=1 Tax=Pocillopora meandrina TaxID=46732 RepID=A0AAU9WSI0_9CNID|nr:unnamed protein product [Pocillopora meandrina]
MDCATHWRIQNRSNRSLRGYGEDSIIKNGGRGARMIGNFILTKDEIIHILVGQEGKKGKKNLKSAGGGGGTFVVRRNNTPLIIAGGGGGIKNMLEQHPGCDASINTTGNAGNNSPLGSGGIEGQGGLTNGVNSGGGGGGFHNNGHNATNSGKVKGEGGSGYLQGGKGGGFVGGFGGGGGLHFSNKGPGGGGGYTGGSGGANDDISCGGGGGSFNNGTNQQNECCYNSAGHGWILCSLPEPLRRYRYEDILIYRYTGGIFWRFLLRYLILPNLQEYFF